MSQVSSILQKATRNKLDRLNIITYPTHERQNTPFEKVNANFFLWQGEGIKNWEDKYAPLPKNFILLNPKHGDKQIPDYITPDVVFSQNKMAHYPISRKIAQKYDIPLVNLEHCLPWPNISQQQFQQMFSMQGNVNVFISDYSRKKWGFDESNSVVIEHGVDSSLFSPPTEELKREGVMVCVNDYINRDWCCGYSIFQQITGHPNNPSFNYKIVGNTPGLSEPAKSVPDLVNHYNTSKVFLCTSTVSPISFALLEAMSCGLPVVAMATCAVPEIITHNHNGMISNNPEDLQKYCLELLEDEDKRKELGNNARKTIIERFSLEKFVNNWEKVFRSLV